MADANFKPVKGKYCVLELAAAATLSTFVRKAGVNWTLSADPKLEDTSNFLCGRRKDEQMEDATLTFTLLENQEGENIGAVKGGDEYVAKLFTDEAQTKFISLPVKIGVCQPENSDQEKSLRMQVTAHLSAIWDATDTPPAWIPGVITWPVLT